MAVAEYQPHRQLSKETVMKIATDTRNSGVIAIVYGLTPTRVRTIKYRYAKHLR